MAGALAAGAAMLVGASWRGGPIPDPADVEAERARAARQQRAAEIAPAPLVPNRPPVAGAAGRDGWGYPTEYVDQMALRSLLGSARYRDLSRYLEEFQEKFEADSFFEDWPEDASLAFASVEPELLAPLDAWVAATPESFAPYLARGSYWTAVGYARRGAKVVAQTPESDFAAMFDAIARGHADLARALAIRPKLVAAMVRQISAFTATGEAELAEQTLTRAVGVCPGCFNVRAQYMNLLKPRWGGSYEAMHEFASAVAYPAYPKLRLLEGYADLDRANILHRSQPEEALAAIERSCKLGDHWLFLFERALCQGARDEFGLALEDLGRALALRPLEHRLLLQRANTYAELGRFEDAGHDFIAALRIHPTGDVEWLTDKIVRGLVYTGWQQHKESRREDALRLLELASEISPADPEVVRWHATIVVAAPKSGVPGGQAAPEPGAGGLANDFRSVQQADYALAREGKFDQILPLWDSFIGQYPNEGRAYLERGGTNLRLHRLKAAHADVTRACELGVSEGCYRVKQIAAMLPPS